MIGLAGNKCDMFDKEAVTEEEAKNFANEIGAQFQLTSAFKNMGIDDLFRIGYIVSALALTLLSFNLISTSFLSFILVLVLGNIGLRVSFELLMLFTEMCYNIRSINKKMK